ncbi:SDR family oxidoreductase [Pontiella agarivorans]|uniref:SDR family oxidoreductase n=1 Tax=Pontiella agarivorans TaxID=3038953 RepID=A0ABU5MV59_9BACT|nr:SDR family oxidoreductase [Pontiella agarivorans]MDZ8117976.1 SDR family oxidoreductase [Pontiella agarivorans]
MKILVTGATGNLGSAVVEALKSENITLKAGARNPEKLSPGTETVRFDFNDAETFAPALDGVDAVFLQAPPMDPNSPALLKPFIALAAERGIKHIVFNSALGADANEKSPLRIIERTLMDSGVPYTITRPNFFMENFSAGFIAPMIAQASAFFLAADDAKTSFISVEDIAAVVAAAFAEGLTGKAFNLTGPRALNRTEAAALISEAAGKTITYNAIPEDAMLQGARDNGMPEGHVQFLAALYQAVRNGWTEPTTPDVEQVLGRPPVSFEEFALKNSNAWK